MLPALAFFLLTSVIGESKTLYVYLAAGLGWSGGGGVVARGGGGIRRGSFRCSH